MLKHPLIPKHGKAGLLCEDLRNDILQQVPDLKGDGLIRPINNGFHADFVKVQLPCRFVRG